MMLPARLPIACLLLAVAAVHCRAGELAAFVGTEAVEEDRFEKEVVVSGCRDAMQIDIASDGRLVFIERGGAVKLWKSREKGVVELGTAPSVVYGEVGLVGMVLDSDFANNGWIYLAFCPANARATMRLSRFTIAGEKLDLDSEMKLLDYPIDEPAALHMGGGLAMDGQGNLYMGTGDNSPPIAELPVDQRPGKEHFDALRSAANSNDLRGKILRIHPRKEGGYDIPAGNLFPGGKEGRAEIYCMGCRNPFRIAVDRTTGWLYWGDVGPNLLDPSLEIGPEGYDEFNQARQAGNFGWPMFVGPNEAYRNFDFVTRLAGEPFDLQRPTNASRNNTGMRVLPPPQPAWIWYPNVESDRFPELGSGGRSAMAGPTYHFDAAGKGRLRIPAAYDGAVFVFDWMRNWIKTVRLDEEGRPDHIEPFLPHMTFRKPIDMKFGPDGCLYVIDYGTKWTDNSDSQILRIVYRRGNRPPVAVAQASTQAGKQPLRVRLSARDSYDKDAGDTLTFAWRMSPQSPVFSHEGDPTVTLEKAGIYPLELSVGDREGAISTATVEIRVGNARPTVLLSEPASGGFFDWQDRIRFRAEVTDEEDGNSRANKSLGDRLRIHGQYYVQRPGSASDHEGLLEPGLAMMRQTTCFSCHTEQTSSGGGPPYFEVSRKYHGQADAREVLAQKILRGGAGVWGAKPMPAHPQHTVEQTRQMADWVLSLAAEGMGIVVEGAEGVIQLPAAPAAGRDAGVYVLSASYTDQGADGAPSLTGEASIVLHSRRKQAIAFEHRHGVELVEVFVVGPSGRFSNGGWIAFDNIDLAGIERVVCTVAQAGTADARIELRAASPDGPLLGQCRVPPSNGAERFSDVPIELHDWVGPCTLFVVARADGATDGKVATVRELKFLDSPESGQMHRQRQAELASLPLTPPAAISARTIVKEWTLDDLKPVFDSSSHGRSFQRGKALFATASCAACHRLANEGGTIGPDLAESIRRLSREANPKEALLRELVSPSEVVEAKYRTVVLVTDDGVSLAGQIVREDEKSLWLVWNAQNPSDIKHVLRSEIDERQELSRSLMPDGLLNAFDAEQIADLLAYIRSAGDPQDPLFQE